MIEKIPFETETITHDGKIMEVQTHASPYDLQVKINELVDAVNELKLSIKPILEERESGIKVYEEVMSNMKPADPFAEQRKYIGCLCRFWNFKDGAVDIGILKAIDNLKPAIPYINDIGCSYAYCEPVKPDDDIIYEGE